MNKAGDTLYFAVGTKVPLRAYTHPPTAYTQMHTYAIKGWVLSVRPQRQQSLSLSLSKSDVNEFALLWG